MKPRQREPNGRHQREREAAPTAVRRLLDAALSDVRHAEWGTELGRLLIQGKIDGAMYVAGKKWMVLADQYQKSIGANPVKTAALELGRGGQDHLTEASTKRDRDTAKRYTAADHVLRQADDPGVRSTVRRVCEDNETCAGFNELVQLRSGLLRLTSHWDLTYENKSRRNVKSLR